MYSGPAPCPKLEFKGTLEEASLRKVRPEASQPPKVFSFFPRRDGLLASHQCAWQVDMLIAKARLEPHHTLLDLGCGWGGVSIRAAQTIG